MRIFISHASSDMLLADAVANLIRDSFIEFVEVVHSSASVLEGGIEAGASWIDWIREQVQKSSITIVILTPNSSNRPWLMWEAGAVSGVALATEAESRVVPLLFGLSVEKIPAPLRTHQIKVGSKEKDILDLLETIRVRGGLTYKDKDKECSSKVLISYLSSIQSVGIPDMYDVFISCPMTSINGEYYNDLRKIIVSLKNAMKKHGLSIYCAALRVSDIDAPDSEDIAAEDDLAALKLSRSFVMIYPQRVMSSCILEAGYALIAGLPSYYFVANEQDLPYMLRGAPDVFRNARKKQFRELHEVVGFYRRYPKKVVPHLEV